MPGAQKEADSSPPPAPPPYYTLIWAYSPMRLCPLKPLKETLMLHADGLPTLELTSYDLKLIVTSLVLLNPAKHTVDALRKKKTVSIAISKP